MHRCQRCEQEKELELHARLVERELDAAREVTRFALTPQERREIEAEERLLARLLDEIEARKLELVS